MSSNKFIRLVRKRVRSGDTWCGPKGGVKRVIKISDNNKLSYWQGDNQSSRIYLPLQDMWDIVQKYKGQNLTSTMLQEERSDIFSKRGHPCNCIALFHVLTAVGLVDGIKPGRPCYVYIPEDVCTRLGKA